MLCLYPECNHTESDSEADKQTMVRHLNTHPEAHAIVPCACVLGNTLILARDSIADETYKTQDGEKTMRVERLTCMRCGTKYTHSSEPEQLAPPPPVAAPAAPLEESDDA